MADLAGLGAGLGSIGESLSGLAGFSQKMRQDEKTNALQDIQIQKEKYGLEQAKAQDAAMNQVIDINTHPTYLKMSPDQQVKWKDFFMKNGFINDQGRGTLRNIMTGANLVGQDSVLFKSLVGGSVEDLQKAAIGKYQEFQNLATKKGIDDPAVKQLEGEYNALRLQASQAGGAFDAAAKAIDDRMAKLSLEKQKHLDILATEQAKQGNRVELKKTVPGKAAGKTPGVAKVPTVDDAKLALQQAGIANPTQEQIFGALARLKKGSRVLPPPPPPAAGGVSGWLNSVFGGK
jgi:hypothetical protein